jgi:hypothetical protein
MNKDACKALSDITIQAIMFDMDVDWETLQLTPKVKKEPEPFWKRKWRENREYQDFNELQDVDQE